MSTLQTFQSAMPFLVEWLSSNGSPAIKYRLLLEVQGARYDSPQERKVREELERYEPAIEIMENQNQDGTWGETFRGVLMGSGIKEPSPYSGFEYQFSRLVEMGFRKGNPVVDKAAELLKLILQEKKRAPLFESRAYLPDNPDAVKWYRKFISIISAKMLSMAGYKNDEILRRWLIDYTNKLNEYLESEKSKSPYSTFKGSYIVDEEIMMAGHYLLDLYAFNKWLNDGLLGKLFLPKLMKYLDNFPPPPPDCPIKRYSSLNYEFPDLYIKVGDHLHRGLEIPSPITLKELRTSYSNRIPSVLKQLEMRARIGFLQEDDPVLLWLLSHQDKRGVIEIPGKLDKMIGRDTYHYYPLHDRLIGMGRNIDTTFRTLLIVHYMGKIPRIRS